MQTEITLTGLSKVSPSYGNKGNQYGYNNNKCKKIFFFEQNLMCIVCLFLDTKENIEFIYKTRAPLRLF